MRLPLEVFARNTLAITHRFRALGKREEMLRPVPGDLRDGRRYAATCRAEPARPGSSSCIGSGASFTTSRMCTSNRFTCAATCAPTFEPPRDFLRQVADLCEPSHPAIVFSPSGGRWPGTMQELVGRMPRAQPDPAWRLVAGQHLGVFIGNPHRRHLRNGDCVPSRIRRSVFTRSPGFFGTSVGLITGTSTQLSQLPVQYEARRTRLVAGAQMLWRQASW